MTAEEIKSIQEIQGSGGFRVISFKVKEMMDSVKDVTKIDKNGLVAEQTLGRQLCYEVLEKFLKEINLLPTTEKETRRTYE